MEIAFNFRHMVLKRILEMVPGLISWSILIGIVVLSATYPITAAILVILFNLFWFLRVLYLTLVLVASYAVLDRERETNWLERCGDLLNLNEAMDRVRKKTQELTQKLKHMRSSETKMGLLRQLRSESHYLRRLKKLKESPTDLLDYRSIYHLIIIPNYREDIQVLRASLDALCQTSYPLDRMIVVIACEEREGEEARKKAKELSDAYGRVFEDLIVTFHPNDLPGEKRVKGANATWAAKQAKEYFQKKKISRDHIIVSCFDADTRVGKEYFGCLTYNFMIRDDRTRCSFQPIPVYHNNVWSAPIFARMMETGSSFFQLVESANPDHLVTFSSHSMSFESLVEADYWPVDMISDDSAIFWRCFLYFKGQYRTVPLHVTLSMNLVVGKNWLDTFARLYVQKRRWAWGIENFPYVVEKFIRDRNIDFGEKVRHTFKMLENHVSWATWGFIITIFGWLPVLFGGREYGLSVVSYNLPRISQMIFHLATVSIVITTILSFLILPKLPPHISKWKNFILSLLQCLLLPIVLPTLLALPALDAQTRLLIGRRLDFAVSSKVASHERSN